MIGQVIRESADGLPGLLWHVSLEGLLSLGTIRFHIKKKCFKFYVRKSFHLPVSRFL